VIAEPSSSGGILILLSVFAVILGAAAPVLAGIFLYCRGRGAQAARARESQARAHGHGQHTASRPARFTVFRSDSQPDADPTPADAEDARDGRTPGSKSRQQACSTTR
jgi:hypothetical protein